MGLVTRSSFMTISPRIDIDETIDTAQQRCFAAARRADNRNDLTLVDLEFDAAKNLKGSVTLCKSPDPNSGSDIQVLRASIDAHIHRHGTRSSVNPSSLLATKSIVAPAI